MELLDTIYSHPFTVTISLFMLLTYMIGFLWTKSILVISFFHVPFVFIAGYNPEFAFSTERIDDTQWLLVQSSLLMIILPFVAKLHLNYHKNK